MSAHRFRKQLHVTVADNGRGLPAELRRRQSSGRLGLQIVRALATGELRGTIELRNRAEGGTEAVLVVPLWQAADHLLPARPVGIALGDAAASSWAAGLSPWSAAGQQRDGEAGRGPDPLGDREAVAQRAAFAVGHGRQRVASPAGDQQPDPVHVRAARHAAGSIALGGPAGCPG